MPLWDKVKDELDRAGKVAQEAIDEGRLRLEVLRVRQLADKAAQRLGYGVASARRDGRPADDPEVERLHAALVEHEAEADRLQSELDAITRRTRADAPGSMSDPPGPAAAGASAPVEPPTPVDPADSTSTDRTDWNREHL